MKFIRIKTRNGYYLGSSDSNDSLIAAKRTEFGINDIFEVVKIHDKDTNKNDLVALKQFNSNKFVFLALGVISTATKAELILVPVSDITKKQMTPSEKSKFEVFELVKTTDDKIALKSKRKNTYVCAEEGGGSTVIADRKEIGPWETFSLEACDHFVKLKANNGKYLWADRENNYSVFASNDQGSIKELFLEIELGNNKAAFIALNSDSYLCAEENDEQKVLTNRHLLGPWETFQVVKQQNGKVALKTNSGKYLCLQNAKGEKIIVGQDTITPLSEFEIENSDNLIDALQLRNNCCGIDHRPRWDTETHAWVVKNAVELLKSFKDSIKSINSFLKLWDNKDFSESLFSGLKDADDESAMNRVFGYGSFIYSSHFYDPDTETNYWEAYSFPTSPIIGSTKNALSEAKTFFYRSLSPTQKLLNQISQNLPLNKQDLKEAGYFLGISLHYFTDITQPMHASNFPNLLPSIIERRALEIRIVPDWRHSEFESYVERLIAPPGSGNAFKVKPEEIDLKSDLSTYPVDKAVKTAAKYAKNIFIKHIKPIADSKITTDQDGKRIIDPIWGQSHEKERLDGAIKDSLRNAQKATARYLLSWISTTFSDSSLFEYFPTGCEEGHKGLWSFGEPGSWFPKNNRDADPEETKPTITHLSNHGFALEGPYDFWWGDKYHKGTLSISVKDYEKDPDVINYGTCTITIKHKGSLTGKIYGYSETIENKLEFNATYRLQPKAIRYFHNVNGEEIFLMSHENYLYPLGWHPGLEFRIFYGGELVHICFEDANLPRSFQH